MGGGGEMDENVKEGDGGSGTTISWPRFLSLFGEGEQGRGGGGAGVTLPLPVVDVKRAGGSSGRGSPTLMSQRRSQQQQQQQQQDSSMRAGDLDVTSAAVVVGMGRGALVPGTTRRNGASSPSPDRTSGPTPGSSTAPHHLNGSHDHGTLDSLSLTRVRQFLAEAKQDLSACVTALDMLMKTHVSGRRYNRSYLSNFRGRLSDMDILPTPEMLQYERMEEVSVEFFFYSIYS